MSTEEEPPVLHPVTGAIVRDPVKQLAVIEDAYTISSEGEILPDWPKIMRPRLLFRAIPKYWGFTQEEAELHQKLRHEPWIKLNSACKQLPYSRRRDNIMWI